MKWIAHRFSGINCSDIRLREAFLTPLIKDFETYENSLEPMGSTSERAEMVRAMLYNKEETPDTPRVIAGFVDGEGD